MKYRIELYREFEAKECELIGTIEVVNIQEFDESETEQYAFLPNGTPVTLSEVEEVKTIVDKLTLTGSIVEVYEE